MCSVMLGCLKWSKKIKWCIHIILKKFVILIRGTTPPFSSILLWKSSKKDDNFITSPGRYFLALLIWSLLVSSKPGKGTSYNHEKADGQHQCPFVARPEKLQWTKHNKNRASIWNDIEIGWTWINDNIKIDKYIYIGMWRYTEHGHAVKVYRIDWANQRVLILLKCQLKPKLSITYQNQNYRLIQIRREFTARFWCIWVSWVDSCLVLFPRQELSAACDPLRVMNNKLSALPKPNRRLTLWV